MIAPIIGGLVASVVLYVVLAALFNPEVGVLAVLVLGAVGFVALLVTHVLAAR